MIEFNEFKKEVCDFYRKNKMTYFIWYIPEYYKCSIQVSFRKNNIEVLFSYNLMESARKPQRSSKIEKLMKSISESLEEIEIELKE